MYFSLKYYGVDNIFVQVTWMFRFKNSHRHMELASKKMSLKSQRIRIASMGNVSISTKVNIKAMWEMKKMKRTEIIRWQYVATATIKILKNLDMIFQL